MVSYSSYYKGTNSDSTYFGLAIDNTSGYLYCSDNTRSTIVRVNTLDASGGIFYNGGLITSPTGLALDLSGNYLYCCSGNNTIVKINTSDASAQVFSSDASLSNPVGLAFDTSGNLYCGNNILKFPPGISTPSVFYENSG